MRKRGKRNDDDKTDIDIQRYKDTVNTEYLCNLVNYAMFEFMYPQHPNAHFRATNSNESTGIVGMSVSEIERFKNAGP